MLTHGHANSVSRADAGNKLLVQRLATIRQTRDALEAEVKEMAAAGRSRVVSMDAIKLELMLLSEQKAACTRSVEAEVDYGSALLYC